MLAIILVIQLLYLPQSSAISCKDEAGRDVDWWILYKLPKRDDDDQLYEKHSLEEYIYEGLAYAYLTSDLPDQSWTLSQLSVGDEKSMPGRTLNQLYQSKKRRTKHKRKRKSKRKSKSENLFNIMYNDEHPHGPTSFTRGHTKGLVFGDKTDSIWLIHSIPHYPPFPNESYAYPHTGQRYGQTAMCISISSTSLDMVGKQLTFNNPFIYSTSTPDWLTRYPQMVKASKGHHVKEAPFFNTEIIKTRGGETFTTFAKFTDFGKDLYADLVAPMLKIPLLVETWPNGPGKMPSRCNSPFIVENVDEMDFPEIQDDDFTTKHDHAKWAISLDKKRPFVCVGDINRMETQLKRGGGTACFASYKVWKTFKKSIKAIEACPGRF